MKLNKSARRLRRDATEAEMTLWRALRSRQFAAVKFRRQVPMRRYVVDFVSYEAKLVIEVDGGQHAGEDPARQRFLESQGFRVLRFWNNDVLRNLDGVLQSVGHALRDR